MSESAHPTRRWPLWLLAIATYLAAAAYMVSLSSAQINPDGIAYIQLARHYVEGRFDLAISSWWSPLLTWLLVPVVALRIEPVLAVKILNVLMGLLLAGGTVRIVRQLTAGRWTLLAFCAALALSLQMLPDPVTPDMMMAAILTWYFAASIRLVAAPSAKRAFSSGLLGGLAFLAKAYALPFVAVHMVMTLAMSWLVRRRGLCDPRASQPGGQEGPARASLLLRPLIAGLAGLLLVAMPWVTVLSVRDGRPTMGSAAQYARRGFSRFCSYQDLPLFSLQAPRPGRLTTWEHPLEITRPWPDWNVLCPAGIGRLLAGAGLNAGATTAVIRATDSLGLMLIGPLIALLLCLGNLRRVQGWLWLWAFLGFMLYIGGYVFILIETRYLWAAWGLLAALAVCGLMGLQPSDDSDQDSSSDRRRRLLRVGLGCLLLGSIVWQCAVQVDRWRSPGDVGDGYRQLKQRALGLGLVGPLAANEWHNGLFSAFWANQTFIGQADGKTEADLARELAPYGHVTFLVFDDPTLCQTLELSTRFREIRSDNDAPAPRFRAFEFTP